MHHTDWHPASWRDRVAAQQPEYPDRAALDAVLKRISMLPPLVSPGEIDRLQHQLAQRARTGFILQGGDCAEDFERCREDVIGNQLKILLQMSLVLIWNTRTPVLRIGRLAGQYAKPRSSSWETIDGCTMPSYRGDAVNVHEPDPQGRVPDPERLQKAYFRSAATLNSIRARIAGGFADLRHPDQWNLPLFRNAQVRRRYESIVDTISNAMSFVEACGIQSPDLEGVEFSTSHEGLLLEYETALTRRCPRSGRWYNLGAHMLWIGERTRQLDGAHVEYFRGIANPIGMKVGPRADPQEIIATARRLNPDNTPGRLTLITRMGHEQIADALPPLVRAVQRDGLDVIWSCDPMHGNTRTTDLGIKTRDFRHILSELESAFRVQAEAGGRLQGVHFELTGQPVTECVGGAAEIRESDLGRNYHSTCDPRLNYCQSLEMAFRIAEILQEQQP